MMDKNGTLRRLVAMQALDLFPQIIRESLLESREFRELYDLRTDAHIVLSGGETSFKRSCFFDAVRRAYQDQVGSLELCSNEGQLFRITIEREESGKTVVLRSNDRAIRLPSFWYMSSNADERLQEFDLELRRSNINDAEAAHWKDRLVLRPAKDDEVGELTEYLKLTPQEIAKNIGQEVRTGAGNASVLVPTRPLYYERLAGKVDHSNGLEEFASGPWKDHVSQLLAWDFGAGLLQALAIAPCSFLCSCIAVGSDRREDMIGMFQWLAKHGDRFSQVAAVELGLSLLKEIPELELLILDVIQAILADDPEDEDGRLKLTTGLVMFVDGEIARLGILRDRPPYWRRLAAIGQACFIERELIKTGAPVGEFSAWAIGARGQIFFLQNLVDLRLEPRWLPDLMSPHQLRFEFVGRIYSAGVRFASEVKSDELRELICGSGPAGLKAAMTAPMAFLPGPLEGGSVSPLPFPDDLLAELRGATSAPLAESALSGIVNMALMFHIESDHARVVTEALRRAKYQVGLGTDGSKIFSMLSGLAVIAAVSRTPELAKQVRILARVQRRRPGVKVEADNLMRIALIAAASEADLGDWCTAVGAWLEEIAYEDIGSKTATTMRIHTRRLCTLVPQLWRACGKAEAVFAALADTTV